MNGDDEEHDDDDDKLDMVEVVRVVINGPL